MQTKPLTIAKLLTTSAIALAVVSAHAQTKDAEPWYAGVDLGASRVSIDCTGTASCDRTGSTSRLVIGKRLNPWFSVEGSYVDVRGIKVSVNQPPVGMISGSFKSSGLELAGLVHTPEARGLSGYAKLGLASMKTTGTASAPALGSAVLSERSTRPVIGVGVNYRLNTRVGLTAGYDWRRASLDGDTERVHGLTVGARYSF